MEKEIEFVQAKAKLLTQPFENANAYDFLAKILKELLNKPTSKNPCEDFHRMSYKLKEFVSPPLDHLRDSERSTYQLEVSKIQSSLYKPRKEAERDDEDKPIPDMLYLGFLCQQAGIGISNEEVTKLQLSLPRIIENHPVKKLRFWGKLFGIEKDYYVVEAEANEDAVWIEDDTEEQLEHDKEFAQIKGSTHATDMAKLGLNPTGEPLDDPPKSTWKPAPKAPAEEFGHGANKKMYFVCNIIGENWERLPLVTPEQITISRKIRHLFTGNLNEQINSNPPFPGRERHFLRAQIVRISSTCIISPLNFYQFDEEAEEGLDEDAPRENFIENPEFEPFGVLELADPGLGNWVHHSSYLLPQGRTIWWNPAKAMAEDKGEIDNSGEEEDEPEDDEEEPVEPETGPPLLTPLSEDAELSTSCPAWSTKISSNRLANFSVAIVSSNLWPGAHAIGTGKLFENVYVGWGQKYLEGGENFDPVPIPQVMDEFISGPEITEVEDPTPEEEAAWRAAQAEAQNAEMEHAEEAENEEEAEEED
ncbi:Radial spoke head protein 4 A [Cichlidogyrus casuarinus]|uniref:Radial spoke head protein 4 A n=1 Tax=Cichlidogyrus casuarinus TaxID=1844966 RepID=A0ABD2Q386_9PLAT